jgi:tetratricopeptide (TPR) repeat protein
VSLVKQAEALEADAIEYPDERGEILREAAHAWWEAGDPERARALLDELVVAGGEDGGYARCELIEQLLAGGRDEEARVQLDALYRDPDLHDGHCTVVAELLASRGDLTGALRWYDRLVALLPADRLERAAGPEGWMSLDSVPLRGRRHIRRELGLAPDATDEITPDTPASAREAFGLPRTVDELEERLDGGARAPGTLRVLTFRRAERAEARRRWPDVHSDPDEEHYAATERRWREAAERGVPRIRIVPADIDALVVFAESTGGSPTDPATKAAYGDTVRTADTIPWPPPRNAPCWCGSGTKYKKCCGRS